MAPAGGEPERPLVGLAAEHASLALRDIVARDAIAELPEERRDRGVVGHEQRSMPSRRRKNASSTTARWDS